MKKIDIAGKRGIGDLISGISYSLKRIEEDAHLVFHYPPGFDYSTSISTIMDEYLTNIHYNITYNIVDTDYSVSFNKCEIHFGTNNYKKDWFFTSCYNERYLPFKTQWKQNKNGPIVLMTNNEGMNKGYPYPLKWFDERTDAYLKSLIDNKNFVHIGRPNTIKQSIEILSNCSRAIGVDGGWVHACNAMNVPITLVKNKFQGGFFENFYSRHPTIEIINTEEIFQYL